MASGPVIPWLMPRGLLAYFCCRSAEGDSRDNVLTIILYSKAGCHLCDEARACLEDVAADHELVIEEIDIRRDDVLFARYRNRIPVIVLDGEERLEGRITMEDVHALVTTHG
jgi:glutaredoxin